MKNYGDINKINQINKTIYSQKITNFPSGNSYSSLHFKKNTYQKNRESSLDSTSDYQKKTGKRIVNQFNNNVISAQQDLSNSYLQQNSHRTQNYGSPLKVQPLQFSSNHSSSNNNNNHNNENQIPHTTICDFYRSPSKDDKIKYQFSPSKRPQFVPDKVSGKKRFDDYNHHDTTITQLINRTSESGFMNDTPSKRLLKTETLTDSFNHLFNQQQYKEGYRPGKKIISSQGQGSLSRDGSAENYQFRNILTGTNVAADKQSGLGMVDQTQYRREEIQLANEFRQKINLRNKSNTQSNKFTSNIFFRDDLPSRENSASKSFNNDSLNNGLNSTRSNKLRERKIELYNSNHVKGCLDHSSTRDDKTNNNTQSRERSINRVPISNISNNVSALMISHEILKKQPQDQQDLIAQVLSSQVPSKGKLVLKDRNQSPLTKCLLKNDTMGTPQRFLLSESSNKISSKHQHNVISQPFNNSTRHQTSRSFFN